ncbi:MAG TPA: MazF family transcriptional regulator [Kosmotogaceae bacterium]|nr:MazF family transcriptional regulator [Kosmotogaceae bacterium]
MAEVLRGQIVWADLSSSRGSEQSEFRPVLVISDSAFNAHSGTVIALAITSQKPRAGYPLTMRIESVDMPRISWVKIAQIRTLAVERLGEPLGMMSNAELQIVIDGLMNIIG